MNLDLHLPLVEKIARRMVRHFPSYVDLDDVRQDGCVGLLQAARRFDEGKDVTFSTFAGYRIRGAILDACRAYDVLGRETRKAYGSGPVEEQLDADYPAPEGVDAITSAWLRRRIAALPRHERHVVRAYYFGGLIDAEIGNENRVNFMRRKAIKRMRGNL